MFWALTTDLVDTRGHDFEQVLADIQTLNQWARAGRLEVTAISLAAYPFVQEDYALLPHGASIGFGLRSDRRRARPLTLTELAGTEIVVPGTMTTSYLTLRLVLDDFRHRELPFDGDPGRGRRRVAPTAGLLIHEGQLTFEDYGLVKVLDLGEWWLLETGLPLPLGVNVARRDLGDDVLCDVSERARARRSRPGSTTGPRRSSTRCSSAAASTPPSRTGSSSMYVNELTQDYGDEGRKAVTELLQRGEALGAFPAPVRIDFVR